MRISQLERRSDLYYGTSYSDYKILEDFLYNGIPVNEYGIKRNDKDVLPLLNSVDMALRFALMQKEYREDLYGVVFSIDKRKLPQQDVPNNTAKNEPVFRSINMFEQKIEPCTFHDLYLFDFKREDRTLGDLSEYFKQRFDVYSRAFYAKIRRNGSVSFFRLDEIVLEV